MIRANILAEVCKPVKKATTAVVLTHNIDFLFVQSILLSRLHSIGHPKLTIFADASCSTSSYNQQFELLSGLGQRYRVVPLDLGNGRRFHPKAIFLAGPDGASLAIGAATLRMVVGVPTKRSGPSTHFQAKADRQSQPSASICG